VFLKRIAVKKIVIVIFVCSGKQSVNRDLPDSHIVVSNFESFGHYGRCTVKIMHKHIENVINKVKLYKKKVTLFKEIILVWYSFIINSSPAITSIFDNFHKIFIAPRIFCCMNI